MCKLWHQRQAGARLNLTIVDCKFRINGTGGVRFIVLISP